MTLKGQLLKSASLIALVTVISRICGYLRDQRVALLLGTSPAADSLVLVFGIPNLIRRLSGEGALGTAFIPVFTGYLRDKPRSEAWAFAQKVFWDMAALLGVLAVLGVVFSREIVRFFTIFSHSPGQWDLAVFLGRIIIPAIFFVALAGIAAAVLNSFHIFGLPAATPIFFNLVLILFSFGILYRPIMRMAPERFQTPAVAIAFAILLGGIIQFAIQIPALKRLGMRFRPEISFTDPGVRKVGRLMGPSVFGVGVYQINFLVDKIFSTSSRMPSGSVMSLYVAEHVTQLVLGICAVAMSTAILPTMSHQAAAKDFGEMKRTFGFSLRVVSFIAIPAAVGLILLRQPIVQVLFQHGKFVAESTALTARALFYYSLGLPAFAAIKLITPMYYSMHDTMTPAKVGAYALGLNILLNAGFLMFFLRYLSNGSPALASSLAAYFNFMLLFAIFRKRHGRLGARGLAASLSKMGACALAMAAVCYAALKLSGFAVASHFVEQAGLLAAIILISTGIYFGLAWVLRCEELGEFFLLLRRAERGVANVAGDL
ncbi:MAG: murein biosynthesis integral membrane protein MurJ [Candidatus Acidiferrales bacterium]